MKIRAMSFEWDDGLKEQPETFITDYKSTKEASEIHSDDDDSREEDDLLEPFSVIYAINSVDILLMLRKEPYIGCNIFLRSNQVYAFHRCENFLNEVFHMWFIPNKVSDKWQYGNSFPDSIMNSKKYSPLISIKTYFPDRMKMYNDILYYSSIEGVVDLNYDRQTIWNRNHRVLHLCWD